MTTLKNEQIEATGPSGRVAGKVVLITGAARGQGRSHAIRMAEEGADLILLDSCENVDSALYPMATREDLEQTAKEVLVRGRRVYSAVADVRDAAALTAAVSEGVKELGGLDVVVANAGICIVATWDAVTPEHWKDTIDINLTGVWNTVVSTIPHLLEAGAGSIIIISSTAGIKGLPFLAPYTASKHGVVGIAKSLTNELGQKNIRVNTVHPTGVNTPLMDGLSEIQPLLEADPILIGTMQNALPVSAIEVEDVTNAVLYLASDEARYVTGAELSVDAGKVAR